MVTNGALQTYQPPEDYLSFRKRKRKRNGRLKAKEISFFVTFHQVFERSYDSDK